MENIISHTNNGRIARAATNTLFFLCGISFASWASRIPDVKEFLNLSDAALGSVLFAMPIGSLTALPVAGIIVGKFGSRNVTMFAIVFYIIALPLLGLAQTPMALAFALIEYCDECTGSEC